MRYFCFVILTTVLHTIASAQCEYPVFISSSIQNTHRENITKQLGLISGVLTSDNKYYNACREPIFSNSTYELIQVAGFKEQDDKLIIAGGFGQNNNHWVPGPIVNESASSTSFCTYYNRVWNVSAMEIRNLKEMYANGNLNISDIPIDILEWPAKNNPHVGNFSIQEDLAHFVDSNNDNIYNPLDGDYPIALSNLPNFLPYAFSFSVYHDQAFDLSLANPISMGIEIRQTQYVMNCISDIPSNHSIFTRAEIVHKGEQRIKDARIALWQEKSLGCEDYLGCDTTLQCTYSYERNGIDPQPCMWPEIDPVPEQSGAISTTVFLNENLLSSMYYKPAFQDLDTFPYQDTDTEFSPLSNPQQYNLFDAQWPDGRPLTIGNAGQDLTGEPSKYAFFDLPTQEEGWSMQTAGIDPKFYYATVNSFYKNDLEPGQKISIDLVNYIYYKEESSGLEIFQDWQSKVLELKNHFANFNNADSFDCFNNIETCTGNDCVWPGDNNQDQHVDGLDYLLSGAFIGKELTGPRRNLVSDGWFPFSATNWNAALNNINAKHGDATGDGKINGQDLITVINNFDKKTPDTNVEKELATEDGQIILRAIFPDTQEDLDYSLNNTILDRAFSCAFSLEFNSDIENVPYHGITFDLKLDPKIEGMFSPFSQLNVLNESFNNIEQDSERKFLNEDKSFTLSWTKTDGENLVLETELTPFMYFTLSDSLFTSSQDSIEPILFEVFNAHAVNAEGMPIDVGFRQDSLWVYNLPWDGIIPMDDFSFNVYPNPTSDLVNIEFEQEHSGAIEVYAIDGRRVRDISFSEVENTSLHMQDLPAGLYCLRVFISGTVAKTVKLIKIH